MTPKFITEVGDVKITSEYSEDGLRQKTVLTTFNASEGQHVDTEISEDTIKGLIKALELHSRGLRDW